MAVLKKEIKSDFTVVHNKFLRDKKLSINARGLLMTMLSMSNNWNFSIKGLASILPDGERKTASTLKELEENGYLIRKRKYEKGKIADWEYIFSDEPMRSNVPVENFKGSAHQNLHLQNVNVENVDVQESGTKEIPYKKISSDEKSIYQSKRAARQNKKVFNISENSEYSTVYKNACMQISKNELLNDGYSKDKLHEVAGLITWVNTTNKPALKINGREIDIECVRREFSRLERRHICYVIDFIKSRTEKIKSPRGYLLTCLYNAPANIEKIREEVK